VQTCALPILHDPDDPRLHAGDPGRPRIGLHHQHLRRGEGVLAFPHPKQHVEVVHGRRDGHDRSRSSPRAARSKTNVGRPSPRSVEPVSPTTCTRGSSSGRTTTSCRPRTRSTAKAYEVPSRRTRTAFPSSRASKPSTSPREKNGATSP